MRKFLYLILALLTIGGLTVSCEEEISLTQDSETPVSETELVFNDEYNLEDALSMIQIYQAIGYELMMHPTQTVIDNIANWPYISWEYEPTIGKKVVKRLTLYCFDEGDELSPALGNLKYVRTLHVSTKLKGNFPPEGLLHEECMLETLTVFNMNHGEPVLDCTLPAEIGNAVHLKHLEYNCARMTDTIPAELGNCTNLIGLYFPFNNIQGELPETLVNLRNLKRMDFSNCHLTGKVPVFLSQLGPSIDVWVSGNDFSGFDWEDFITYDQYIISLPHISFGRFDDPVIIPRWVAENERWMRAIEHSLSGIKLWVIETE